MSPWQKQKNQSRLKSLSSNHWMTKARAGIDRLLNLHGHSLSVTLFFFLIGYAFFTWTTEWVSDLWIRLYYLWDKTSDMLAFICIFQMTPQKKKRKVYPVVVLLFLRLAWEALSLSLNLDVANSKIVGLLFGTAAVSIILTYFFTSQEDHQ